MIGDWRVALPGFTFALDRRAGLSDNAGMTSRTQSEQLFAEALKYIPGGVNSPVRAFRAVGGQPFFVNKAKGARVWDVDGNEYIDYVGTWGPAILGHAHPKIIKAVQAAAQNGTSFGIPNPFEVTHGEDDLRVGAERAEGADVQLGHRGVHVRHPPGARVHRTRQDHQVRRLLSRARGLAAGQGRLRRADVRAPRQRRGAGGVHAAHDRAAVQRRRGGEGRVRRQPRTRSPASLSSRCRATPVFICRSRATWNFCAKSPRRAARCCIFDEVMTGFRLAKGGAQERFGITPDLTCFGKIIGGGLPVGAFGGRAEIMDCLAPLGPVYQAGTLSGNPVAMAAGIAALEELAATRRLRETGSARRRPRSRHERRREVGGRAGAIQSLRLDVLRLLHQRAGP